MKLPSPPAVPSRLLFAAFLLLTSFYCLLAYIPFTYTEFIQYQVVGWVTIFAHWHTLLYWGVSGLLAWSLLFHSRERKRTGVRCFLFSLMSAGIALVFHPLLTRLQNDLSSLAFAFLPLAMLAWLGFLDLSSGLGRLAWADIDAAEEKRVFWAVSISALLASLGSAGLAQAGRVGASAHFSAPEQITAAVWSTVSHLLIFMAFFAVLSLLQAISGLFPRPARAHFILVNTVWFLLVYLCVLRVILYSISMRGLPAYVYSLAFSLSLTSFTAGLSVRLDRGERGAVRSGLSLTCRVWGLGLDSPLRALALILVIVPVYTLSTRRLAAMDWDFVMQKLAAALLWTVVFAGCYNLVAGKRMVARRYTPLLLVPLAFLGLYRALDASGSRLPVTLGKKPSDLETILDRHAGFDPSFKLAREVLTPPLRQESSFYALLQKNSNIPREIEIPPVPYVMSEARWGALPLKPHIFLIVIDSLRRDYVAPYNPKVRFTPSIEAFARESVVFENAFTPYGSTGLAEPAIWAGGLLLHKQYFFDLVADPAGMTNRVATVSAAEYQQSIRDYIVSISKFYNLRQPR